MGSTETCSHYFEAVLCHRGIILLSLGKPFSYHHHHHNAILSRLRRAAPLDLASLSAAAVSFVLLGDHKTIDFSFTTLPSFRQKEEEVEGEKEKEREEEDEWAK